MITPEQIKAFIQDAKKVRENWLIAADASWNELQKKSRGKPIFNYSPNSVKRRAKYPLWWSIFKIRQPLYLSRVGIPIGKDTTQDGNDTIGAVAAICKERLATNLAKSFDFFDVMCSARDDFLATNFALTRGYYEAKDVKELVKKRVQQIAPPTPEEPPIWVDDAGEPIEFNPLDLNQDDEGYYIETNEVVDVTEEKIILEHCVYKNVYIDPSIKRWPRCKQIAFEEAYTAEEFKKIFGRKAYENLPNPDEDPSNANKEKKRIVKVYEYWDLYNKECAWIADNGDELIYPKAYIPPDEGEDVCGIYNLEGFFPVPPPLVVNQSTDAFWPVPEYQQLYDCIEDVHTIFSRIVQCTRAIRARLLFDDSIEGLKEALSELAEGDAIGVTNLAQALVNSGGSIDNAVQYVPLEKLIESLQSLYQSLEQRLGMIYKLTGTSDLIQGFVSDPQQRTFGERQIQEKYALNQSAEPQRKMAEYVRDCYELICEMALKNFKDESLDRYIMPQTLQPDQQAVYRAGLSMLKENNKRFRIELETDSTIAMNEEYDKQMRMQLVEVLTNSLEKTANIATNSPALIVPELHAMKFLIQGFRQGKLFQSEITQAIDNIIKQNQQPAPAPFNKDEASLELQAKELEFKKTQAMNDSAIKEFEMAVNQQMEREKFAQEERLMQINAQLDGAKMQNDVLRDQLKASIEQMKAQSKAEEMRVKLQIEYERMRGDLALAQQNLLAKQQELEVQLAKTATEQEREQLRLVLDARIAEQQHQIDTAAQQLEEQRVMLSEREKYATEQRLQAEHQLSQLETALNIAKEERERQTASITALIPQQKPKRSKKKIKVIRDDAGNIKNLELEHDAVE